ncbi:MAG: hypothetical protein ACREKH_15415 [Candidatus Rokuibacteriota bacterium]
MRRWVVAIALGMLMLCEILLSVPLLFAQTPGGPFEQMSPGNQKGTRALFEAQKAAPPAGMKRLTLDEIAARKQGGEGWTRVFQGMKSQGLIDAANFREVVESYDLRWQVSSGSVGESSVRR